ncbi:unnamed protein product [Dovyalis caffra]|uniref:Sulfurtransferase n=1 Tax=Dovyalis caffra TaxID=77055 RepID=A0AAV1SNK3_9ROSI|nr:unnamed protein product [Dovyalis caffra]
MRRMFRVFGHEKVWVLDGGLPCWRASGYDVESSASGDAILKASAATEAIEKVYQGQTVGPITFQTKFQPHLVWTLEQPYNHLSAFDDDEIDGITLVKRNIEDKTHQHIDARSKGRFDGSAPEPRKGIKSGHVPGSNCIPFVQMLDASQTLLPADELKKRFDEEGNKEPLSVPGLHRLGKRDVTVYDGSWTEWGANPEMPVDTSS